MAKDYKNSPKPKDKVSNPTPGWIWMLAGLSIGLFVAVLVYVKDYSFQRGEPSAMAPVVEKSQPASQSRSSGSKVATKASTNTTQKPRFDFYNLLPEMEVFIPEQQLAAERENPLTKKVTYYLQAGSFQRFEDADRLRAQLALLSFESQIQRVTIDGKKTWHRVRVGPFNGARKMDIARTRLHKQQINPVVIKVKN